MSIPTFDLATARDLGGWSSVAMLNRYSHHRPQRARDAVAAMLSLRETAQRREVSALTVVGGPPPRSR